MKLRFLRDYRGRETYEHFVQAGEVFDVKDEGPLLKDGFAVADGDPDPAKTTATTSSKKSTPSQDKMVGKVTEAQADAEVLAALHNKEPEL